MSRTWRHILTDITITGLPAAVMHFVFSMTVLERVRFAEVPMSLVVAYLVLNALVPLIVVGSGLGMLTGKRRVAGTIGCYGMLLVWYLGYTIYYHYFFVLPSPLALLQVGTLPQLTGYIFQKLRFYHLVIMAGTCWFAWLSLQQAGRLMQVRRVRYLGVLCLLGATLVVRQLALWGADYTHLDVYNEGRGKYAIIYGYTPLLYQDLAAIRHYATADGTQQRPGALADLVASTDDAPAPWDAVPANRHRQGIQAGRASPAYRRGRRPNIITIQVESLDYEIVHYRVNGKAVMPFLAALAGRSLRGEHFFAQHLAGGSSDAELSTLTSLLPDVRLAGFMYGDFRAAETLPAMLKRHDYYAAAMHANTGAFYNREQTYCGMGFDRFDDAAHFSGAATGWHASDAAFFQQVLGKLSGIPHPYYLHLVTMQSHGPYENHQERTFFPDTKHLNLFEHYIESMHAVDTALQDFVEGLTELHAPEDLVIVMYGDHSATEDPPFLYNGRRNGEICQQDQCAYFGERVPLIITGGGLAPHAIAKVGSHVDLAPTILDLLDIPPSDQWVGTSLLDAGPGVFVNRRRASVVFNGPDATAPLLQAPVPQFGDRVRALYQYSLAQFHVSLL